MSKSTRPTSGRQWRKAREEGIVVTLPSGNIARLRPVALDVMLANGQMPDLLAPIAAKSLWDEIDTEKIAGMVDMAKGMADLFGIVCKAALLEPRVVDNPTADDEIALDDIEFQDKAAIFQLAIAPTRALELFRRQQEQRLAAVHDGQGGEREAE